MDKRKQFDAFFSAYLQCALWSSTDDNGEPLDKEYSVGDFNPEPMLNLMTEAHLFFDQAYDLIQDGSFQQAGHDFWLTRNGHGAGFWDGKWNHGNHLTQLSKVYGECDLYIGDDGYIYASGYEFLDCFRTCHKGLSVHLLYNARYRHCALQGPTTRFEQFLLVGPDVPEVHDNTGEYPVLVLRKRNIKGSEYLSASPLRNVVNGDHVMMGGNYITTSDSRFPNRYPIPVHDRKEQTDD